MEKNLRVLFVSGELIAGDLAYRLVKEGCDVKLYIADESRKDCFENMVEKTKNWRKELKWVGKTGLIVFDDVGYGKIQDDLRKEGYKVVGGCEIGDKLEQDREFGQYVLKSFGLKILQSKSFVSLDEAKKYILSENKKWVIKQNGHISMLNYVGEMKGGADVIKMIDCYKKNSNIDCLNVQERAEGIEVGVARYFNGHDFVGPVEINVEHKSLFNDGIGPKTAEMGTVMWYENNDNFKLYRETLGKMKPYLEQIGFRGDVDIDFIVNKKYAYPLEFTTRFGSPAVHLQDAIHISKWKDFLTAVATGENFKLKFKKGFGVVVSIAIPPFPYVAIDRKYSMAGVSIFLKKKLSIKELENVHFEEVSYDPESRNHYISGHNGYVLYITGVGQTIEKARRKVNNIIAKLAIPKMFYRTDIGEKFASEDYEKLKEWGWL